MLCCVTLCPVPCYFIPCRAMPCHVMPCYVWIIHSMLPRITQMRWSCDASHWNALVGKKKYCSSQPEVHGNWSLCLCMAGVQESGLVKLRVSAVMSMLCIWPWKVWLSGGYPCDLAMLIVLVLILGLYTGTRYTVKPVPHSPIFGSIHQLPAYRYIPDSALETNRW